MILLRSYFGASVLIQSNRCKFPALQKHCAVGLPKQQHSLVVSGSVLSSLCALGDRLAPVR